jgi:hypothetical protein
MAMEKVRFENSNNALVMVSFGRSKYYFFMKNTIQTRKSNRHESNALDLPHPSAPHTPPGESDNEAMGVVSDV